MIKINKPSFLATSEDTQTSSKVSELSVIYSNVLGSKVVDEVSVPQGYIQSYVMNETQNSILNDNQEVEVFTSNILIELTDMYIAKLKVLNPTLTFINTLK